MNDVCTLIKGKVIDVLYVSVECLVLEERNDDDRCRGIPVVALVWQCMYRGVFSLNVSLLAVLLLKFALVI